MRFTWVTTGDRVFEGPPVHRGFLSGFSIGAQRWARKALQVDSLDSLDTSEIVCLYYALSLKQTDHNLLPITRQSFDDLTPLDFEIADHPFILDKDDARDSCRECNQGRQFRGHIEGEPDPTRPGPDPAE